MVWAESQVAVPLWQVLCGENSQLLAGIRQPELELALWRRSAESVNHEDDQAGLAALGRWLADLRDAVLPAAQLELRPSEAVTQLQAACGA